MSLPVAADQDVVAGQAVQRVVAAEAQIRSLPAVPLSVSLPVVPTIEAERGVGELQPLDVAQRVGTVDRSTLMSVTVSLPSARCRRHIRPAAP